MSLPLRGVLPAVVTPFDANEDFAPAAMERLLDRLFAKGAHGIYVLGQTGEGVLIPVHARKRVAEVAIGATPAERLVVIHVGAARTADAVELARHASRAGAHAVSSLPPAGALSFGEIKGYYQALSGASDVPLLVYFFPEISAAVRSAEEILELCAIPNVIGLKFTDFDLFKMRRVVHAGYTIFNGRDEVFAAGLLMGAHGGIGSFYNLVPELFVQVYDLAAQGKWMEARGVQDRINALIAITLRCPPFPAIKQMLAWSGFDCGGCLAPRRPLTSDEESRLRRELQEAGLAPDGFLQ